MKLRDAEWIYENEWLHKVLEEARKQFEKNRDFKERFKRDYIETQKELWQDMGSISIKNGLDEITDFMQFINIMKMHKRSHEFTRRLQDKFERILSSPYFGRIDFIENGEEKAEKYYIGISNLIDENFNVLVYDWRAPISSMFYDYEIGDAHYECPEGIISGKLTLKRQYKINNGKLEYMFDSNLKIDDEVLQDILGKSTDNKMKTIVTTIQREQNKVIRNEDYKNLIVQGPAGSGKTSVALHRIAYLLYKHRDKIRPENIVIFSPNEIFNDYISDVLPQLGEQNMIQTTFQEYMHNALGNTFVKESYCQMMEYILSSRKNYSYQKRIANIKFKSSIEFIDVLKRYVSFLEKQDRIFSDIIFKDRLIISSGEIKELFYKNYALLPLKKRLQKIKERILFLVEPYKKKRIEEIACKLNNLDYYMDKAEISKRSLAAVNLEMKNIYDKINRMTEFNLMDIYRGLFEKLELFYQSSNIKCCDIGIEEIKSYTLENLKARILNYEDQPPLLYLKSALGDLPKTSEIKYVIIDEAQDYTPLQYEIINQLFKSANMTILGDMNQCVNPFMNVGDYSNISRIFPKDDTCMINLTKSYRSTMEITKFSRRLLNKEITDECVARSGDEPLLLGFPNEETRNARLLEDIKKYNEKGYKSIGIIKSKSQFVVELLHIHLYNVNQN